MNHKEALLQFCLKVKLLPLEQDDPIRQVTDPKSLAKVVLKEGKDQLEKLGRVHAQAFLIRKGEFAIIAIPPEFDGVRDKDFFSLYLKATAIAMKLHGIVFMAEAWMKTMSKEDLENRRDGDSLAEDLESKEGITVSVEWETGEAWLATTTFSRGFDKEPIDFQDDIDENSNVKALGEAGRFQGLFGPSS